MASDGGNVFVEGIDLESQSESESELELESSMSAGMVL